MKLIEKTYLQFFSYPVEYLNKFQSICWIFMGIITGEIGYSIIKKQNTIAQVIVGFLVGILIGYIVYKVGKNKIKMV